MGVVQPSKFLARHLHVVVKVRRYNFTSEPAYNVMTVVITHFMPGIYTVTYRRMPIESVYHSVKITFAFSVFDGDLYAEMQRFFGKAIKPLYSRLVGSIFVHAYYGVHDHYADARRPTRPANTL